MDIFWNHTLLRNWGINISVAAVRDLNIPITFSSSKESLNFALPFSNRLFPLPFHFSSPLFYPCHGCVTSLLLEAWNCKICRTREWSLSRSWPLIKEENWAELTFAKTSGTVTRARARKKNRPIADRHVPSNDPRTLVARILAPVSVSFLKWRMEAPGYLRHLFPLFLLNASVF